jgi:hypothetical protein
MVIHTSNEQASTSPTREKVAQPAPLREKGRSLGPSPDWLASLAVVWVGVFLLPALVLGADDQRDLSWTQQWFTTDAYKAVALHLLLDDVNRTAPRMELPERFPIQTQDLVEVRISSPFMSDHARSFGSISTRNYYYFASVDNKLSFIVRNVGNSDAGEPALLEGIRKRYEAPKSEMNTNAAYLLATQWLAAAGIDVTALERDSRISIFAWDLGKTFVPVYMVSWSQPSASLLKVVLPADDGLETVAGVQLVEPEHRLLQMHVNKPQYIKGKPLMVPNRDQLLQETPDPKMREMWFTTSAYKEAALHAMLAEANRISRELSLSEAVPIEATNLVEVSLATPFLADHLGWFANISTKNYVYSTGANKLDYVYRNFRLKDDEPQYLSSLKRKYAGPKTQSNANAAYALATNWLALASMDVEALERECTLQLHPWETGGQCVPLYELEWVKLNPAKRERDVVATVEVLVPERLLLKLWVERPEFNRRKPLVVQDRERLLSQTNTLPHLNAPTK